VKITSCILFLSLPMFAKIRNFIKKIRSFAKVAFCSHRSSPETSTVEGQNYRSVKVSLDGATVVKSAQHVCGTSRDASAF